MCILDIISVSIYTLLILSARNVGIHAKRLQHYSSGCLIGVAWRNRCAILFHIESGYRVFVNPLLLQ